MKRRLVPGISSGVSLTNFSIGKSTIFPSRTDSTIVTPPSPAIESLEASAPRLVVAIDVATRVN
jgi:hypothetical protein